MAPSGVTVVATNRQAKRDFEIYDIYEAGLVLRGSEVKSLRTAKAQLAEAYVRLADGEAWINSLHISPYERASFGHLTDRPKKLLLNRKEIRAIKASMDQKGLTMIALSLYFKGGRAKVEIATARRKRKGDKRQDMARSIADKEARQAMSRGRRG